MEPIKTPDDVKQLGTILSIWAHPDDESFCCAGIMAAAVANGQRVVCLTATKGEAGVQDESRWPAAELGKIRAVELQKACDILGITDHHWLGYHDGHCHEVAEDEAVALIKQYIKQYQPDTILTFGPDGMTGHADHQSVSRWVGQATQGTNIKVFHTVGRQDIYDTYLKDLDAKFNIYFNIDKPVLKQVEDCAIALELTAELKDKKYQALAVMPSQTEAMLKSMSRDVFDKCFGCECFIKA